MPVPATDSVRACVCELVRLFRSAKRLHAVRGPGDPPLLDGPAFGLLMRLREHERARPSALAEAMGVDLSTVSRQIAGMEAAGWVVRERDARDGRASLVAVTATGRDILDRSLEARGRQLGELLGTWTEDERRQLAALLGRLNHTIEERSGNVTDARLENA